MVDVSLRLPVAGREEVPEPQPPTVKECDDAAFLAAQHAPDEQTGKCPRCNEKDCEPLAQAQAVILRGFRAGVINI